MFMVHVLLKFLYSFILGCGCFWKYKNLCFCGYEEFVRTELDNELPIDNSPVIYRSLERVH